MQDAHVRRIKIFTASLGLCIVCLTMVRHMAKYGWSDQSMLMALGSLGMLAVALPLGWKIGLGQVGARDEARRADTRTVKIAVLLAIAIVLRIIVVLMDRFEPAP